MLTYVSHCGVLTPYDCKWNTYISTELNSARVIKYSVVPECHWMDADTQASQCMFLRAFIQQTHSCTSTTHTHERWFLRAKPECIWLGNLHNYEFYVRYSYIPCPSTVCTLERQATAHFGTPKPETKWTPIELKLQPNVHALTHSAIIRQSYSAQHMGREASDTNVLPCF